MYANDVNKLDDARHKIGNFSEWTGTYSKDHYKFVPAGYVLTAGVKANEKSGHYYISDGTPLK